jgi:hypothetical protein
VARNKTTLEIVRIAAERAASEPAFFAHVLREYRAMFGLDLRSLATKLGCNIHDMTRLALCRKPDFDAPKWQEDLEQIAHFVHVDSQLLLQLLREVDTLTAMRGVPATSTTYPGDQPGLLAAARLRKPRTHKKPKSTSDKGV